MSVSRVLVFLSNQTKGQPAFMFEKWDIQRLGKTGTFLARRLLSLVVTWPKYYRIYR